MKRVLLILFCLLLSCPINASGMLDVDYNFIDTAFDGIKPVTDKQFNDTINKLTPQPVPDTFGGKFKTFLFGRKYGQQPPKVQPQTLNPDFKPDTGGEKKAIEDIKNGTYYIKLLVSLIGYNGEIIPLGNYKIQEKTEDNVTRLVFYQGPKEYGKLKLSPCEDELKGENDLTYSRVDILDSDSVRVVYATIKDTKCAFAGIYDK